MEQVVTYMKDIYKCKRHLKRKSLLEEQGEERNGGKETSMNKKGSVKQHSRLLQENIKDTSINDEVHVYLQRYKYNRKRVEKMRVFVGNEQKNEWKRGNKNEYKGLYFVSQG